MKNLTLIIPARNEKETLPQVIDEIKNLDCKKKVILAQDDIDTINAIKNLNVDIIYQNSHGFGDALITGINNVDTDYFCIFNADGSFDPKELKMMYQLINSTDFVFGSRYMENAGSEDDTIMTYVGNKIFTLIGNLFFSLNMSDILYTFVMGRTKKAQTLNLKEKDFGFCVELPIKAKKSNLSMSTCPCNERKRIAGKKKVNEFRDGFNILISMIKLFFK
jgi:glycosyltransferase involved in cell wall biosynthesis